MAWEGRGPNKYYYRKKRVNGHVVSVYVGKQGGFADAKAQKDKCNREKAAEERIREQCKREGARAISKGVTEYCDMARMVTSAILKANGYYKHKGQWRKKRE